MQVLAKNFLCVADEVWALDHADTPGAKFWKEFVKKASGSISFGATTKQGVYAMTPDGEFLGGHFARHTKADTMALLKDALKKWSEIAAKKGLKSKPIPPRAPNRTWGAEGLARSAGGDAGQKGALILQVVSRDLPFKGERYPGPAEYKKAYNQTWIDLTQDEMLSLLPKGGAKSAVPDALFRKIAKETLVDDVRGQTEPWTDASIRKAALTAEAVSNRDGGVTVRFEGEFAADDGKHGYDARLYGRAIFDSRANRFRLFELVSAGMRKGGTAVNFRFNEPPSPLGIAFIIEDQYEKAVDKPATGLGLGLGAPPPPEEKKPAEPKAGGP